MNVEQCLSRSLGETQQAFSLLSLCESLFLRQLVSEPTRGNNLLDIICSNNEDIIHNIHQEKWPNLTDHNIIFSSIVHNDLNSFDQSNNHDSTNYPDVPLKNLDYHKADYIFQVCS